MKTALLALLTTLALALGASALQAQPGSGQGGGPGLGGGGGMRMNPEVRIQELIGTLEVTPAQEPAFREAMARVIELQRGAMGGMRQGGDTGAGQGPGGSAAMPRRAEIQQQAEALLAAVLNAAQMAKFRELEDARMSRMRERNAP
jgi:Spy/CpxP family protein refolding chaperone